MDDERRPWRVDAYLMDALLGSEREKQFILSIEESMRINLRESDSWSIEVENSYMRMLAHRVARYHGMEHYSDAGGKFLTIKRRVNVGKCQNGHLLALDGRDPLIPNRPLLNLAELVEPSAPLEQVIPRKFTILKRNNNLLKENKNAVVTNLMTDQKDLLYTDQPSLAERARQYFETRARIFDQFGYSEDAYEASFEANGTVFYDNTIYGKAAAYNCDFGKSVKEKWKDLDQIKPFIPSNTSFDQHSPSILNQSSDTSALDLDDESVGNFKDQDTTILNGANDPVAPKSVCPNPFDGINSRKSIELDKIITLNHVKDDVSVEHENSLTDCTIGPFNEDVQSLKEFLPDSFDFPSNVAATAYEKFDQLSVEKSKSSSDREAIGMCNSLSEKIKALEDGIPHFDSNSVPIPRHIMQISEEVDAEMAYCLLKKSKGVPGCRIVQGENDGKFLIVFGKYPTPSYSDASSTFGLSCVAWKPDFFEE